MPRHSRPSAGTSDSVEPQPAAALSSVAHAPHLLSVRDTFRRAPSELDAFLFEFAALAGRRMLGIRAIGMPLRSLGHAAAAVLEAVSPAMPFSIREHSSLPGDPWGFYSTIFKYCFPITVLFCLGVNAALAFASGTFMASTTVDHEESRMFFVNDGYNIFLYLIICPLYVSAAVCVIATTAISWNKFNGYSNEACGPEARATFNETSRFAVFIGTAFLVSGLFIAQYISDLTDPTRTPTLYWFFDLVGDARVLNPAGAYYLFMNAVLLFITAMATFCYIAMSIEMFRLGRHLETSAFAIRDNDLHAKGKLVITEKERHLRQDLADFSYCYVWAKFLVLIYALNIWIWQISPAGRVQNMHASIMALIFIGVFFLVIPRLYLNSKWHAIKGELLRKLPAQDEEEEVEYRDIRSGTLRKISLWIDLMFGMFLAVILGYQYDFKGIAELLLETQRAWWPR